MVRSRTARSEPTAAIPFRDLMEFKQRSDTKRKKARDELVAEAQEEHMGY